MHKLYNLSPLIEGALVHNQYYGNNLFLEFMLKHVALIHKIIGSNDGRLHGYLDTIVLKMKGVSSLPILHKQARQPNRYVWKRHLHSQSREAEKSTRLIVTVSTDYEP